MSASQAVFRTYELLENILLHLEAHDIQRSRRVAKEWLKLVDRSIALHEAHYLKPVDRGSIFWRISGKGNWQPLYKTAPVLPLQAPGLVLSSQCRSEMRRRGYRSRSLYEQTGSRQSQVRYWTCAIEILDTAAVFPSIFVTSPPCQAIGLALRSSQYRIRCTVYVKHGVRLSDLAAVYAKMSETFPYSAADKRKPRAVAEFVVETYFEVEEVEKSDTDSSSDVEDSEEA